MIIILCGVSATGKDTYLKLLQNRFTDFKRPISVTTRPMRQNEQNGREYFFVNQEEFDVLLLRNELVNHRRYEVFQNGEKNFWHYGVPKSSYSEDGNYIMILDPQGAVEIKKMFDNVSIIYLQCSYEVAKERATLRGDEMLEFERRIKDDFIQFDIVKDNIDLIIDTNLKDMFEENLQKIATYLEDKL